LQKTYLINSILSYKTKKVNSFCNKS
jgi:hypothetical protein